MTALKELLSSITVRASSVEDLSKDELESIVAEHSVVAIRGLIQPAEIVAAKARVREHVRVGDDHSSTGETPQDLRGNFQKFCLGDGSMHERDFPKCLRTCYNPIWADDIYGMREPFRRAARVRNLMMGFPPGFAVDEVENRFWTASRIHHYPAGGGFMGIHQEDYIPTIYKEFGVDTYYQPLIIMSKKGEGEACDYESGGGFFEKQGVRYHYEEETELGDIAIYDTRIWHGVAAVDPHKPFRQDSLDGRFAGFVTMYRDFSQ